MLDFGRFSEVLHRRLFRCQPYARFANPQLVFPVRGINK